MAYTIIHLFAPFGTPYVLEQSAKYLGENITENIDWCRNISDISSKAGVLRRFRDVYLQGLASYLFHQYYCLRVNRVYAEINTFLPPFSKRLFIAMIHRKV